MSSHLEWAVIGGLAFLAISASIWILIKSRHRNIEKREHGRRTLVNRNGRLGDALITGFTGTLLYYSYTVSGVQYSASQDVGALLDRLPPDLGILVGMAKLKYLSKNPANSILLSEEWSGLKAPAARTVTVAI